MNYYKISIMQLGYAIVRAQTEKDAEYMIQDLYPDQIYWLSNDEQNSKPYLVTLIEQLDNFPNNN